MVCGFGNFKEVVEKHWGWRLPDCFEEAVGRAGEAGKSRTPKLGEETPLFHDTCSAAFSMTSTGASGKEFLQGPPQ